MLKRKDGSANRGAAVYAYEEIGDFVASIKIVTNLQKIFKKVEKTKKIRLTDGKGRDTMITPLLRGY